MAFKAKSASTTRKTFAAVEVETRRGKVAENKVSYTLRMRKSLLDEARAYALEHDETVTQLIEESLRLRLHDPDLFGAAWERCGSRRAV